MSTDRIAPDISDDELLAMTPDVIRQAIPTTPWKIEELHKLKLPILNVSVNELSWLFELPLWQLDGIRFKVTPKQVMLDPKSFPDHYKRIIDSDLSHPIATIKYNRRLTVLDGMHRLANASLKGKRTVPAIQLSEQELQSIC